MKTVLTSVTSTFALFLLFFIMLSAPVYSADIVYACNSTEDLKETFYTNESVYVVGNVSVTNQEVYIYIVNHKSSWTNGTSIISLSLGYTVVTSNSTGWLPISLLWETPDAGSYDIVADVNKDGIYNDSIDVVDNKTIAGFVVYESPKPTLAVVRGDQHPPDHDFDLESGDDQNVMMQINISASEVEDIIIKSTAITASGTGDDKEDIKVAYFIYDLNDDGNYTSGDIMLGYSVYTRDDGAIFFDLHDGFLLEAGESRAFMITYNMDKTGSVDDTYKLDLVSLSGIGRYSSDPAVISGLPIGSAVKTISKEASITTTTTTTTTPSNGNGETTTTTTTTTPTDECQTDNDCPSIGCAEKKKTTYRCELDSAKGFKACAGTIVTVECCQNTDCTDGYYCLNYECVKEKAGPLAWLKNLIVKKGEKGIDYTWTAISILAVSAGVIAVFLIIKNRKKGPRKTEEGYEHRWKGLREKWE